MPFPMRIQPIDTNINDVVKPPVVKSRLKRLFDRPFNTVLKISSSEKPIAGEKDATGTTTVEFEPSSVCLDKMVQNFIEDNNNERNSTVVKCGRNLCGNCFHGHSNDSSDDELDFLFDTITPNSSFSDLTDTLKGLISCASIEERNLLADTSKFVEKYNKICKRKDDLTKVVTDNLTAIGYNAAVCKSKWEKKTPSVPAGEYEYIDVIIDGDRIIIDVDFRSEFVIARSTSSYKAILQSLPQIFVGKSDRLLQIVSIASEAARVSLKKKGMHIAPWRKSEYMKSKWLSSYIRTEARPESNFEGQEVLEVEVGELDLIFGEEKTTVITDNTVAMKSPEVEVFVGKSPPAMTWQLPALKPKSLERTNKVVVTGLASLLKEKN